MVEYTNKMTGERKQLDKEEFLELMATLKQEAKENKQLKREIAKKKYQREKAKETANNTYLGKILQNS
jgi:hypothetical protein